MVSGKSGRRGTGDIIDESFEEFCQKREQEKWEFCQKREQLMAGEKEPRVLFLAGKS